MGGTRSGPNPVWVGALLVVWLGLGRAHARVLPLPHACAWRSMRGSSDARL